MLVVDRQWFKVRPNRVLLMLLIHVMTNLEPVFSTDLQRVSDVSSPLSTFLFGGRFSLPVHSALWGFADSFSFGLVLVSYYK